MMSKDQQIGNVGKRARYTHTQYLTNENKINTYTTYHSRTYKKISITKSRVSLIFII